MSENTATNYPDNLYDFYRKSPDFEEKTNMVKKVTYYALLALCLLLIIYPSIIPFPSLLVRIIAGIGLVIFGFAAFLGGVEFYNKKSGGKIVKLATKKFAGGYEGEEALLNMFNNNDYKGLAEAPEMNNQPLQLDIHEDKLGKTFYLQLMQYYSQSDLRGMSDVKVISEPEYSQVYSIIKSIKSTATK